MNLSIRTERVIDIHERYGLGDVDPAALIAPHLAGCGQGNCELCGVWDSTLIDAVCSRCRTLYNLEGVMPSQLPEAERRFQFPCNEYSFGTLLNVAAVVTQLDEAGCGVVKVTVTQETPVIQILHPLPEGLGTERYSGWRKRPHNRLVECGNAKLDGCHIEWETAR